MLSTTNVKLESGSNTRKLHPKYCGPFRILTQISSVSFKVELSHPMLAKEIYDTLHVSLFLPYKADKCGREKRPRPAITLECESLEYEVDQVLDRKKNFQGVEATLILRGRDVTTLSLFALFSSHFVLTLSTFLDLILKPIDLYDYLISPFDSAHKITCSSV